MTLIRTRSLRTAGFTRTDLSVVIGILFLIGLGAFIFSQLTAGRGEAQKVQCAGRLKHIGHLASMYAENSGSDYFPFGEGDHPRAHDSINKMVRFFKTAKKVDPGAFICPEWSEGQAAPIDPNSNTYQLESSNTSYAWTSSRLSLNDAGVPLSSDKYIIDDFVKSENKKATSGHQGGMMVLYSDLSVRWMLIEDIKEADNDGLPEGLTR